MRALNPLTAAGVKSSALRSNCLGNFKCVFSTALPCIFASQGSSGSGNNVKVPEGNAYYPFNIVPSQNQSVKWLKGKF